MKNVKNIKDYFRKKDKLDKLEFAVFQELIERASHKGYCSATQQEIADDALCSRPAANKALNMLEKEGLISSEVSERRGPSKKYIIAKWGRGGNKNIDKEIKNYFKKNENLARLELSIFRELLARTDNNDYFQANQQKIAEDALYSRKAINLALKKLESEGIIETNANTRSNGFNSKKDYKIKKWDINGDDQLENKSTKTANDQNDGQKSNVISISRAKNKSKNDGATMENNSKNDGATMENNSKNDGATMKNNSKNDGATMKNKIQNAKKNSTGKARATTATKAKAKTCGGSAAKKYDIDQSELFGIINNLLNLSKNYGLEIKSKNRLQSWAAGTIKYAGQENFKKGLKVVSDMYDILNNRFTTDEDQFNIDTLISTIFQVIMDIKDNKYSADDFRSAAKLAKEYLEEMGDYEETEEGKIYNIKTIGLIYDILKDDNFLLQINVLKYGSIYNVNDGSKQEEILDKDLEKKGSERNRGIKSNNKPKQDRTIQSRASKKWKPEYEDEKQSNDLDFDQIRSKIKSSNQKSDKLNNQKSDKLNNQKSDKLQKDNDIACSSKMENEDNLNGGGRSTNQDLDSFTDRLAESMDIDQI